MSKRKPKSLGKRKVRKTSLQKLSNKHLNKLAKQGKLKKGKDKSKALRLIKERTQKDKQDTGTASAGQPAEDIPLHEADYEYFASKNRDFSFLTGLSSSDRPQKRKHKKDDEDDDEHGYEKIPRKTLGENTGMKPVLPIKTAEHGIQPRMVKDDDRDEEYETQEAESSTAPGDAAPELPAISMVELYSERHRRLAEAKQKIATLSTAVLEAPEENIGKLRSLRLMLETDDPFISVSVMKLTVLSLLEVFKDIIPSYHIRVLTEKEKKQSMKKETKNLSEFEEGLVSNYRLYLEFLEAVAKGKPIKAIGKDKKKLGKYVNGLDLSSSLKKSLVVLATRCLCELLVTHPHFNYRTNIVALVVPFADNANPQLSDMVCGYVKRIFKEDKSGELTLEVVRLIGRLIKSHHFKVQPKILDTFLSLRIKEVEKPGEKDEKITGKKRKTQRISKREKKRSKQMKHLEKELEEAAAETNKKRKIRLHTEVINMVFLTYFRILKQSRHSSLLSTVLQGLAKFAHLINVEFFDDLFTVLKELVSSEELTFLQCLHCIQTAFTILTGQGSALNIDPLLFYSHLYKSLLSLTILNDTEAISITLHCLDAMICKRRKQVSTQRILAFTKRLSALSLQQNSHGALGLLSMTRLFLQNWSACEILLDTACDGGSGMYLPELDQPEHSNAHSTALYELHLLKHHFHPNVRRCCHHLLAGAPVQGHNQLSQALSRRGPTELVDDFDPTDMTFNPTIEQKPKLSKKKRNAVQEIRCDSLRQEAEDICASLDNIQSLNFLSPDSDAHNVKYVTNKM